MGGILRVDLVELEIVVLAEVMGMRVKASFFVAFAILPDDIVNRTLELCSTVVGEVLVRSKDAVADDVVLLDTIVNVHS